MSLPMIDGERDVRFNIYVDLGDIRIAIIIDGETVADIRINYADARRLGDALVAAAGDAFSRIMPKARRQTGDLT